MNSEQYTTHYNRDSNYGTNHALISVWILYLNNGNHLIIGIIFVMISRTGEHQ